METLSSLPHSSGESFLHSYVRELWRSGISAEVVVRIC